MKNYDVIIVGGGPAGSILAARLSSELKVLIVERRFLQTPHRLYEREKSCGGMLDETAQKALAQLQIPLPQHVLTGPQVFAIRAIDMENNMERYYPKHYLNIDRARFDAHLMALAAARPNVTVWEGAIVNGFQEEKNQISVKVRLANGKLETVKTSILVGADGAGSVIRRKIVKASEKKKEPRIYASLQEWHPMPEALPYYVSLFDEEVTDFYSWIIPEDGKMIIGSAMPAGPDVKKRFEKFKQDLTKKGFDVSSPIKTRGALILRPRPWGSVVSGKGRVFLIGEAAGLISPSSAEGISFALRSGAKLAKQFPAKLPKGKPGLLRLQLGYQKSLLPLKISIALKSLKSPIMYGKKWRGLVFKSKALSMKVDGKVNG